MDKDNVTDKVIFIVLSRLHSNIYHDISYSLTCIRRSH